MLAKNNSTRPLVGALMVAVLFTAREVPGGQDEVEWKTGARFRQQLELPADIHWRQNPLRPALMNLAARQQVAIFLDRRVDPDQPIDFASQNASLDTGLRALAAQLKLGVGHVGDVVYVGPEPTASALATLVAIRTEQARQLPTVAQRRLLERRPMHWPMLAEPKQLVKQIGDETGIRIANLDQMPHDLWPSADLPPLTAIERLTLLLAGFQVTFEFDPSGESLRMVAIPDSVSIKRSYALGTTSDDLLPRLRASFPRAQFSLVGSRLHVDGPWETHDYLERLLKGESVRNPPPARTETVYSLSVQNQPVRAILQAIAAKLSVELQIDKNADAAANQLVTFSVENASLQELLKSITTPAALQARVDAGKLIVTSAD